MAACETCCITGVVEEQREVNEAIELFIYKLKIIICKSLGQLALIFMILHTNPSTETTTDNTST